MILDTSVLLAILMGEPEGRRFSAAIIKADLVRLSVASYLETATFVDRNGDEVRRAMLDTFLEELEVKLEAVTVQQIRYAREAFQLFGKGRHAAGLNFGDCFTYALARDYLEPVLYRGNNFSQTDLVAALY